MHGGDRPKVSIDHYSTLHVLVSRLFIQATFAKWQHLGKGFFIEPTIITEVSTSMQIWREEVFGPVICVKVFKTESEAVELANDTQ